jgi:hypothetical protein
MCANTAWRDLATTTSSSGLRRKTASWQRLIACAIRYRLPKPIRLADHLVAAANQAMG